MEIIHSKNSTNDNIFNLFESLNGTYQLQTFQMTNHLGNIFLYNQKVYLNVNDEDYKINIPIGHYTFSQLPNAVQNAINTATGESFSVSGNSNTRKLTFSNATPFKFNFLTFTNKSAKNILGITGDTALSTTHTSNIPCDLNSIKSFFCHVNEENTKPFNTTNLTASFIVSVNAVYGDTIQYPKQTHDIAPILTFKNVNRLSIEFTTLENEILDFSDYDWFFIIRKI